MVFNRLSEAYTEVERVMERAGPEAVINEKLLSLETYIHINGKAIQDDLIKHRDHLPLIHKIGQISTLHNTCAMLELKVLLQSNDPKGLADWVLQNKAGVSSEKPQELFNDLSNAREQLSKADLLAPDVGNTLSYLVTAGLGLKGHRDVRTVKAAITSMLNPSLFETAILWINPHTTPCAHLEALAHWVNTEKLALDVLHLSQSELETIAPYLHNITNLVDSDFADITHGNPERFLNLCSNAYEIYIVSKKLEKLKLSSQKLQAFNCNSSTNLTSLDLSNCKQLKKLNCGHCGLSTLNLSNNKELLELSCEQCPIETLDLSDNKDLQELDCSKCPIETLDLSHNPQLKVLRCWSCDLSTLDLSHNLQLKNLVCTNCQKLETLDLSHHLNLLSLYCSHCVSLVSLGDSLTNTLQLLQCNNCTNLRQLPQMAPTATVFSRESLCGDLYSFKVSPAELEQHPAQVLLNLGKILLQNKPMPNIVYLNSPGADAGGLRRQLVATLCENLFKKDEDGFDIPVLDDVDALRTFARLLGLGIPTGTNLHPSFFHALFALSDEELAQPLTEPLKQKLHMAQHGLTEADQDIAVESDILAAIAIVAKELRALLGLQFREFGKNIPGFMIYAQGSKVTKENLKESILCNNSTYKEWIDSFIEELPERELKNFVMLLTGSYTLGGDKIIFEVYPERKHAESSSVIHTCSKTMELASDYDEDELKKELKAQLKLIKSFNAV